jgi:16S rRNA (uracil1498-N3)-methyltransferase
MHRFYLPPSESKSDAILLKGREAHHALNVLRVRPGEQLLILDGAGGQLTCKVQSCERNQLRLSVTERKMIPPPPFRITLIQAVPKGKIIESIIQKATELGVARIIPLLSERVVTRLDERDAAEKKERWQEVAIEAIKQCGSAWLPEIEIPLTPANFLTRKKEFDLPLIASLQPGSRHPREYFNAFHQQHGCSPKSVCIWIGPEGDFTPEEVAAAESSGAQPITLGPLVLRAETAATYCLSVLNYESTTPSECD